MKRKTVLHVSKQRSTLWQKQSLTLYANKHTMTTAKFNLVCE